MNLKKALILSIAGLVLWSAWGSEVHAGENIKSGFIEENGEYLSESDRQQIYIGLEDWRTLEEAGHRLTSVPKESLYIAVLDEELNMNETARRVKLCWDVNRHRNHYSVKIIAVGPLRRSEDSEIEFQHLVIPATGSPGILNCAFSQVDINYDGQDDLLINEGFSGGSGGSWGVYRVLVWDNTAEEFVWYPSFPTHLVYLEFNEQRMISRYRSGAGCEGVLEYSFVDGEYAETRELVWESEPDGSAVLSYYEMGVLVTQRDVSGLDRDGVAEFYPDLDYWFLP